VLINVIFASVSVIWFWVATEAQLGSLLPSLRSASASNSLMSWFLVVLFSVNILQIVLIYARGRTISTFGPNVSRQRRSYRVAIGKIWPSLLAIIEIFTFRILWSGYQIHSVVPGSAVSLVELLQAYGGALLIFGWLSWVNRRTVRSMSRVFGASLEPVVALRSDGLLVLGDGHAIPMASPIQWPQRRAGRLKVVTTYIDGEGRDVYVTEDGDTYYAPQERGQQK
jgi:hypothetical protein